MVATTCALVLGISLISAISNPAQAVGETSGGVFVPVSPSRLADTAVTGGGGTFAAGETRSYQILGAAGVPATGVSAVVVDIAATSSTVTSGALTMWPAGETRPNATNMYYSAENVPRSNTSLVKVGSNGKISVYTYSGTTGLNIDIQGYFTAGSTSSSAGGFVPTTPFRAARSDAPAVVGVVAGQVPVGSSRDIQITGDEIPTDATGVFANIEVRNTTIPGQLKVGPGGTSLTSAPASVNYGNNGPVNSGMTIKLDATGRIRITNASGSPLDFRVDIQGYFAGNPDEGGSFTPMTPALLYATSTAGNTQLGATERRRIKVTGLAGIPDDATVGAIAINMTVRGWDTGGSVTLYNSDEGTAGAGTSFFGNDVGDPNNGITTTALVAPSDDGYVTIYNSSAHPVTVYLTAQGWFSAAPVLESDDTSTLLSSYPDYTPSPQIIQAAVSQPISFSPALPAGFTALTNSNQIVVKNSAGTRVGSFTPVAVDVNGHALSATVTVSGSTIQVMLPTTGVDYPVVVATIYAEDGDPDGVARVNYFTEGLQGDPAEPGDPDSDTPLPAVNENEVDGDGYVIVDPANGNYDPDDYANATMTFSPLSASGKPPKVTVPSNYKYHPHSGPRVRLHDYCTGSPDTWRDATFRGPCARHDMCYESIVVNDEPIANHLGCDTKLLVNLRQNCAHTYSRFNPTRYKCQVIANTYFAVVVAKTLVELNASVK